MRNFHEITLSVPPSANSLYINRKAGGRARSKAYRDWIAGELPKFLLKPQGDWTKEPAAWPPELPSGGYWVSIRVNIDHRRDLDNVTKPVLDLLCRAGVLKDDRYVNEITLRRDREQEGCHVLVHGLE